MGNLFFKYDTDVKMFVLIIIFVIVVVYLIWKERKMNK